MEELKTLIRKSGIPLKKFCRMCGVSYGRMVKYLNEFEDMPRHVRDSVEELLVKCKTEEIKNTSVKKLTEMSVENV